MNHRTLRSLLYLLLCLIASNASTFASTDSVVVFNEINYHPVATEDGSEPVEWIELHNQMGIMTDVSGWRLADGVSYTIPQNTIIPPDGYLVISSKPNGSQIGPMNGALSNSGERIQLYNQSDRLMDEITYADSGRWPVAPDGSGVTLAKADPNAATGTPQNWTWSTQMGGTPGSANFPGDDDVTLAVSPVFPETIVWRYSEAGVDFGSDWAASGHAAGGDWKEGAGVMAFEPTLTDAVGTQLNFPALNDPYATTYYFELDLPFDAETVARMDHLLLSHLVDDGIIFHLNGIEVLRYNMPAGDIGFDTLASENTEAVWIEDIEIPANALVAGMNRLSAEVHQARIGSSDVVFGARMKMAQRPPTTDTITSSVRINEVTAAGAGFWVELKNDGTFASDASGMVLSISGSRETEIVIADGTMIEPGDYLVIPGEAFPFPVTSSDRLFLLDSSRQAVVDARAVSTRLRGRDESLHSEWEDRWLYPSTPTPGGMNTLDLSDAIVINEIFYNGPAQAGSSGTPPTLVPGQLFGFDQVWRYDSSGNDPGADWAASAHSAWPAGPGLLGFDNRVFPDPIQTEFPPPNSINPRVLTHYFETEWSLSNEELALTDSLLLWHYVDDGAVFYVNGIEVDRFKMPAGEITAATLASEGGDAERIGPILVPAELLVEGVNRISVEVHQSSAGSSDIVFGLEASSQLIIDNGKPAVDYAESNEQWIELYNRSDASVDLTAWSFSDGVSFTFPADTRLDSGNFAVIAKDSALFSTLHPGVEVIGEFSGSISRSGEHIELSDALGNTVDSVHFFDDGRWPTAADGGGSSLELRDQSADNSTAESWAASDTTDAAGWNHYSYRGISTRSKVGTDSQWREFIMGLLFAGEILVDDISVIEEPDTASEQLITNMNFSSGETDWRLLGNHRHSEIVDDPSSPGNQVLRLVATGPTGHMHNHLETTLVSRVTDRREYQISFRAKWISGCNQLNTRLYFNRLPMIHAIDRPLTGGTPGAINSQAEPNIGPSFTQLSHDPPVPDPGQLTTIQATASDPDGITSMTLHYSAKGGTYQEVAMQPAGAVGQYQASLPGQSESTVVQFYISAEDSRGAISHFPAAGPSAGAAYEVNDGNAETNGLQNFRIVISDELRDWMHTDINVMSNDRIPVTVIVDEERIYYDVGLRLKGSERARSQVPRVGFNVRFNADDKFRGIHETVSIDRSEGVGTGQLEMLFDVMIANSGGNLSRYYDLIQIIAPQDRHVGGAVLQLARYEDLLIESQFGDGSAGTRYEYELIYYPTTADRDGYKRPQPDGVVGTAVRNLGDSKEDYRWNFLIKDDREQDTFDPIIAYCQHFSKRGAAFEEGLEEVVDVDNWLRGMAYAVMSGAGDNAGAGSQHNGMYYARPDGRVMFLPHDMDFAFDASRTITANPEVAKIVAIPRYARIYYGHLQDIAETTFNRAYMEQWTDHFAELLPRQRWSSHLSYINSRSNNILSQVRSRAREVDFAVTTDGPLTTDGSSISIEGTGWVNVRQIRLAENEAEISIEWTDETEWTASLPVAPGLNRYILEAIDFNGNLVGTSEVEITGTGSIAPASAENLIISEIHYHPADLTQSEVDSGISDSDDFEFVEFWNKTDVTIDLSGVRFLNGITFTFDAGAQLQADARFLIVRNPDAFKIRYPDAMIDGSFSKSGLANNGERLTVVDGIGRIIVDVRYNDKSPWPVDADGTGFSLVYAAGNSVDPLSWRPSANVGGTPGTTDAIAFPEWMIANDVSDAGSDEDLDGNPAVIEYVAGQSPSLPGAILFTDPGGPLLRHPVSLLSEGIPFQLEVSSDLITWQPVTDQAEFQGLLVNLDGETATATWMIANDGRYFRLAAQLSRE